MVTNPNVSSDTFVITKNKASRDMMRKVIIVAGLILFMVIGRSHGQEKKFYDAPLVGVKTNALYWLTTTINVGAEIGLGRKTTVDLLGTYNPWSFGDNKKVKHWLIQPEFRYWTCERFNGHFWGLHAFYGEFNMGGIKMLGMRKYRYEGTLYGARNCINVTMEFSGNDGLKSYDRGRLCTYRIRQVGIPNLWTIY